MATINSMFNVLKRSGIDVKRLLLCRTFGCICLALLLHSFVGSLPAFALDAENESCLLQISSGQLIQSSSRVSISDVLAKVTNETVCEITFTNQKKTQALVITAEERAIWMEGCDRGKVWFVDGDKATLLYSASKTLYFGPHRTRGWTRMKVRGGYLYSIDEGTGASAPKPKLFFVGSRAYKVAIAGVDIKKTAANQFSTCVIGYARSHTTETRHRYYFKWNGKRLVEYGGKPFSPRKLANAKGGEKIVRAISKSGKMKSAYYRGNGIINVNCTSYGRERFNVVLRYKAGKLFWTKQTTGGNALMRSSWDGWAKKRIPGGARKLPVSYPRKIPVGLRKAAAKNAAASTPKAYWYVACFTPKSFYRSARNEPGSIYHVAGCRASVGKKSFKLTGKLYRSSNKKSICAPSKLLSKKTRSFKVSKYVKFYYTGGPPCRKERGYVLDLVKNWNKTRFGTMYMKCVNGTIVQWRCAAA